MHFRRCMCRRMPNTRYLLDEANGIHPRTASPPAQERCVQQGLGRRLSPKERKIPSFFHFYFHQFPRYKKAYLSCCARSEEHTSELQSRENLVCRLLLEKQK